MSVLDGRRALVTGGSRGIGRAIVTRLARDGAHVVFGYAHDDEAARLVEQQGEHARGVRTDLATEAGVHALLDAAHAELGGLDLLVNNAAVSAPPHPLAEIDLDEFERVLAVNTRAVLITMRYAARHMDDGGRIVNISSLTTVRPVPGTAAYTASKGAVEALTMVAAKELGARGITVNTVRPGTTETDMLRSSMPAAATDMVVGATALGRLGRPDDIADVVAFLCGPGARWITGHNLPAAGGLT